MDPRAGLVARLGPVGRPPPVEALTEQVLLGELPLACLGAKARAVVENEDADWRTLLLVAARSTPGTCLTAEEGDALAAWGASRPSFTGARAEWLAARGDPDAGAALLGTGGDDSARLRIALARGDGDLARSAAEGALVEDARDVVACRVVAVEALLMGDAAWAIESAACGGLGTRSPDLLRTRAEAFDRVGAVSMAEALYAGAGADVHRAAILYQDSPTPERLAEAVRLLAPGPDGRTPPMALHALWLALLHGGEPSLEGLDESFPAVIARAVVRGGGADVEALESASNAPAAVVRAYVHAARGDHTSAEAALADALASSPSSEPVHRARVAVRIRTEGDVDGALAAWAAQDPDHVAAVGRWSRDIPWDALVPETWEALALRHPDPRARVDAASGEDAIGAAIRMARGIPDVRQRADALAVLVANDPRLDGLVAERYRLVPSMADLPDRDP